ncbi:VWA domain-containing protein [bacterium (Candidatus Blackallbacteria) CG17_big_fil_post_rev_8_21_14_2_50_48_46]|uniref:VWA domain-containing protein n=1 Tax=bacterium (Candidatus Blackallbacteria) CG17_big_fil_post_rev_8_21_14_2_50_48_46 TaxID=2014261 RepID=A0A2M7G3Q3_9BACT|nr:MAG: VWA domain-containing protein [bacterium (Candidatus Blackallbacteria) CG18_big_fil_WC_8_21_14_2_50_49_26]PIW16502.1 MAG: VWA domain-containing protein [bacterium (Candidatus Blackallbacteria) CG17_big_fil_post_rev_8_21_14_2_50_48_46]PIW46010.1 MAG: VWA domain-containing protein [bacterium (Candidatus Blackallbacteria) CG13_big_fil_rev_8_21_14_2_50_49_14]
MRKLTFLALLALSITACQPSGIFQSLPIAQPSSQPSASPSAPPVAGNQPPAIPRFPSQGPLPSPNPAAQGGEKRLAMGSPMMDGAMPAPASAESGASGGSAGALPPASYAKPAAPVSSMPTDSALEAPVGIDPIFPAPNPQAGTLTAGEWNDLNNWAFWLSLFQDQEWSTQIQNWGINTQGRVKVVVTGPNGLLADIPVQLRDAETQTVIFEARTNTQGEANLFTQALPESPKANKIQVQVSLGKETLSQDLETNSTGLQNLNFSTQTSPEPAVNADLMWVVDTTGSMGDELEYLKTELKNVASQISAQNRQDLKLRLSANFYRDLSDEYVVRAFPFSEQVDTVLKEFSEQAANGGGDFPEAVDAALQDAVDEHEWSATARARLLFLVLDAPAHEDAKNLLRLRTSLSRAAAKGIRIIPIASSGIDKNTEFMLRQFAILTGGRYVFLTDDSGVGNSHLKPTVGKFSVEKLNALMVRIANEYIAGSPSPAQ